MKYHSHLAYPARRKQSLISARYTVSFLYFIFGFFIAILLFPRTVMTPAPEEPKPVIRYIERPAADTLDHTHDSQQHPSSNHAASTTSSSSSATRIVTVYTRDEKFINAWRHAPETCDQWISIQQQTQSYLDAYVVGSQKGATSELSKNLFNLGVRQLDMVKEWHFFNRLNQDGDVVSTRTVAQPLPPLNLPTLRRMHYVTGFPHSRVANDSSAALPTVDTSPTEVRRLALDMTVEYLHSDRSAFLAHLLTPHAKIVITVRNPLERALSQYNMNIRNGNKVRRRSGLRDRVSTPEEFHFKVKSEIRKLKRCGYDQPRATLDRKTSELVACLFNNSKRDRFDDALYVTRGLYHLHIQTWRNHFPDHHILVVSFQDVSLGKRRVYQSLTDFLCVKSYPETWLESFEKQGSTLSFGQLAAKKGLESGGFDNYHGNDRYLLNMLPETETLLKEFYAPADRRLKALLGNRYAYWSEDPAV